MSTVSTDPQAGEFEEGMDRARKLAGEGFLHLSAVLKSQSDGIRDLQTKLKAKDEKLSQLATILGRRRIEVHALHEAIGEVKSKSQRKKILARSRDIMGERRKDNSNETY